ncbi:Protein translocase subunit SecDF [Nocardioides aquaticus]|uniref:Protein translocase subunit SecD n=1 Tax=Nocardioides aquaticus TaxID=160826 RepID=A0ABX8EMN6_9ACTN|nr:protein translocase subunit SecD [Nocardioides aquaticus]QVT80387.1 Protein translocase subunit SecDF [Nocardioides aquaticus]
MARRKPRPLRTLTVFFVLVALSYGLVAVAASWSPRLGLDLQGGTQITLQAEGDPSGDSLSEARAIIDQRVNGSGVAEAEVTTQGGDQIVVEVPGENQRDLVETVSRQAQLRFRLVACSDSNPCGAPSNAPVPGGADSLIPDTAPGGGNGAGNGGNGGGNGGNAGGNDTGNGGNANRAPVGFSDTTPAPSGEASPSDAASPSESPAENPSASPSDAASEAPADPDAVQDVQEALAFMNSPTPAAVEAFNSYTCRDDGVLLNSDGEPTRLPDDSTQPLVACSEPEGSVGSTDYVPAQKYLLSEAVIQGTSLTEASAGIPQGQLQWVVSLQLGGDAVGTFATISRELVGTGEQFAVVLDGSVISAPTMDGVIPNGQAQISGNFNEVTATSLTTSLQYGALPISFGDDPNVVNVGPTLAGNQLGAGILAGLIGLGLVMIYCMLYYRGLGLVIIASLLVAGAVTYSSVLLLAEAAGFTLTLPGIAGLIVAVGITADSFIVYFERIRDEMRDGKSMRVAVESAWPRARATCVAADAVSILAAVVLYIFAAGVVKGFAFALGLSTIIDLVVFFFFTKPMVSSLARLKFFNTGHRFSGLSDETLGLDTTTTAPVERDHAVGVGGRA